MKNKLPLMRAANVALIFLFVFLAAALFAVLRSDSYEIFFEPAEGMRLTDARVYFGPQGSEQSDIVTVHPAVQTDKYVSITMKARAQGHSDALAVCVFEDANGTQKKMVKNLNLRVNSLKMIIDDRAVDNYSAFPTYYFAVATLSLLLIVYFAFAFRKTLKSERYSYRAMCQCAVICFFMTVFLLYSGISKYAVQNYHKVDAYAMSLLTANVSMGFTIAASPLALIFAVLMTVSNIALIRHEGFAPKNALGILIGLVMNAGMMFVMILYWKYDVSSGENVLFMVLYSVASALYSVFISLLIGAMVCGAIAAKHVPPLDRDFIIILGCRVRRNGTLTPLLQGRADKALEFYRRQEAANGKKALFIPSGGQGRDESVSEAEAIRRYLIQNGIAEEQIFAETQSVNTRQNMRFSRKIISELNPNANTAFATTNYHVFRSGILASAEGLNAEGIGSHTRWYYWPNAYMREIVGLFVHQPRRQFLILIFISLLAGLCGFAYSSIL